MRIILVQTITPVSAFFFYLYRQALFFFLFSLYYSLGCLWLSCFSIILDILGLQIHINTSSFYVVSKTWTLALWWLRCKGFYPLNHPMYFLIKMWPMENRTPKKEERKASFLVAWISYPHVNICFTENETILYWH